MEQMRVLMVNVTSAAQRLSFLDRTKHPVTATMEAVSVKATEIEMALRNPDR